MRYRLDYSSPWMVYTVGWYPTLEACEIDIETRFEALGKFKRDEDGVLRLILSYQDNVVLELHEIEG